MGYLLCETCGKTLYLDTHSLCKIKPFVSMPYSYHLANVSCVFCFRYYATETNKRQIWFVDVVG